MHNFIMQIIIIMSIRLIMWSLCIEKYFMYIMLIMFALCWLCILCILGIYLIYIMSS